MSSENYFVRLELGMYDIGFFADFQYLDILQLMSFTMFHNFTCHKGMHTMRVLIRNKCKQQQVQSRV